MPAPPADRQRLPSALPTATANRIRAAPWTVRRRRTWPSRTRRQRRGQLRYGSSYAFAKATMRHVRLGLLAAILMTGAMPATSYAQRGDTWYRAALMRRGVEPPYRTQLDDSIYARSDCGRGRGSALQAPWPSSTPVSYAWHERRRGDPRATGAHSTYCTDAADC